MSKNINIPKKIKNAKENIKEGIEKILPGTKNDYKLLQKKKNMKVQKPNYKVLE